MRPEGELVEMGTIFDIHQFDSYKENNRREVKKASGGLPDSLWATYSAFANCYGGVIILGVKEEADHSWTSTGLDDADKLQKDFWNTINNPKKVSLNLLKDDDVAIYELNHHVIMVIHVPMAKREQKPVYINDSIFGGTYRRNYEGDFRCTAVEVKAMLRDQQERSYDSETLDHLDLDALNAETIRSYRNRHRALKATHPFGGLDDDAYLRNIGAAAISDRDHKLHPTAAGMLMFGDEYNIVREFPEYFLDYRELLDPSIRWTDRVYSSSGEWSGNLYDFYFRIYHKLTTDLKVPFQLHRGDRIDDTPIHEALREALANCIINADYCGSCGIVITKEMDKITFSNPGYIRTGKKQMRLGGISDPRNKSLMKMFNLINIGERAGSGVPNIFQIWNAAGYVEPMIEEQFSPDRTTLSLPFLKRKEKVAIKQAIKASDKKQAITASDMTLAPKTAQHMKRIRAFLSQHGTGSCHELAQELHLSEARVRAILAKMEDIEPLGPQKSRRYRLK